MLSVHRQLRLNLERRVQRKRETDHGSIARARLDQALALQLLGAVLHAGHAVTAVKPAVDLE